jgi:Uncharacterized conserved protein (DUF2190)
MATVDNIQTISAVAGANLSGSQYLFVKQHSVAGEVVVAGNGENALGVLVNDPVAGQAATVAIAGKMKVIAGGTVAIGALVSADAAGKAVVPATGEYALGFAVTAGVANQVMEILLINSGRAA